MTFNILTTQRVSCFRQYDRIDHLIPFNLRGDKCPVFGQFLVDEFHLPAVFKFLDPLFVWHVCSPSGEARDECLTPSRWLASLIVTVDAFGQSRQQATFYVFSGSLGRGDRVILSTIRGTVALGCFGIRTVSTFASAMLADLDMRGFAISLLTLAYVALPGIFLRFFCDMHT